MPTQDHDNLPIEEEVLAFFDFLSEEAAVRGDWQGHLRRGLRRVYPLDGVTAVTQERAVVTELVRHTADQAWWSGGLG